MDIDVTPIEVLIVQDDKPAAAVLQELLQHTGISISLITHVRSLTAALKFLKGQHADIIFLDPALPGEPGLMAFLAIQQHCQQAPVVMLSNVNDTRLALEAINNGAQDLLIYGEIDEKILAKTILYSIERKRISESLLFSNERYKLISKATNDMVWDWDLQKNKIFRNKEAWDRLFGEGDDESGSPDSWRDRVHPADRKRTDAIVDHVLNSKDLENFEIECRLIKNDGTFAFVVDRGYAIRNEDGEAIRLIGVTQDVTRQKEAEEKLRASEKRFRSIIEKSKEGLALLAYDGALLDISAAGKNILGYTSEIKVAVLKENFVKTDGGDDIDFVFQHVIKKYGRVKAGEYLFKKPDDSHIWLEGTFHNLLNEPAIQAVVVHFRDSSARKSFEEGLKVSEEKYRNLFNVNPSSIIICDPYDFSIIEVNDAAVKEFGYSRKEFFSLKTSALVTAPEGARLQKMYKKMREVKDFQYKAMWEGLTSHGDNIYLEVVSRAINYYGRPAVLAICNNISEKISLEKKLEEERMKQQHEITRAVITAQEQERELLGKELHDNINQILVTTKLYIEYALANEDMHDTLLNSSKDFIATAVAELRNLSKTLLPPSLGEVGLIMALDELAESLLPVNTFKLYADWKNIDEDRLSDQLKLTIFRIIQEQLSNIIKHSQANNVWIKIKIRNKRLYLTVKDDGNGFDVNKKNSGVGLKNITSRAALHNGIMKLSADKGHGCTLTLTFCL